MGDRAQVKITNGDDAPLWLYTHWHGTGLVDTVRAAIRRGRSRWNDAEYLARIIFCEMLKADGADVLDDETGFGIGTGGQHGDVSNVVLVDMAAQTVNGFAFTAA